MLASAKRRARKCVSLRICRMVSGTAAAIRAPLDRPAVAARCFVGTVPQDVTIAFEADNLCGLFQGPQSTLDLLLLIWREMQLLEKLRHI